MASEPGPGARGVVVWSHARSLLGSLRPQVWVALQDLVLDAEWREGRLVAASSARHVAEHLHIDPGTAAAALRVLRDRGFAELSQSSGTAGRFGLAAYTLLLPTGVEVVTTRVNEPRAARPSMESPHTVLPVADEPCLPTTHTVRPWEEAETGRVDAPSAPAARPRRRRPATAAEWSQGALDLGMGES